MHQTYSTFVERLLDMHPTALMAISGCEIYWCCIST